ncbi:helix-turn-helix domain-containing protein [Thermopolyspora sp. NPDC052614]|uniref:TetR/AcrR family transcriptional regulator n=1 Tax=Thermopolyspora sp. NPDC052614 TaxID=3155682 RepID=UPI00343381AE
MAGVKGQVQRRGVERRKAIIDAAIELFSRQGYRGTGISAVAEAAGVTAPAVLHHFGSKERLLEAVINEIDRRALERVAEYAGLDPLSALQAIVRDVEFTVAAPGPARLYTVLEAENLEPDDPLNETFRTRSRQLRHHLGLLLRDGVEAGQIRADVDTDLIAQEIVAFLEGSQLMWLLDPEVDLVGLCRSYIDGVVMRIAADAGSGSAAKGSAVGVGGEELGGGGSAVGARRPPEA